MIKRIIIVRVKGASSHMLDALSPYNFTAYIVRSVCTKFKLFAVVILGIIKRKIKNKTKDIIFKFYKALVRPYVGYCI